MLGCFLQGRLDLARMRKIVMVASGIQAPGTLLQLDAAAIEKRLRDVARGLDHPVPHASERWADNVRNYAPREADYAVGHQTLTDHALSAPSSAGAGPAEEPNCGESGALAPGRGAPGAGTSGPGGSGRDAAETGPPDVLVFTEAVSFGDPTITTSREEADARSDWPQ